MPKPYKIFLQAHHVLNASDYYRSVLPALHLADELKGMGVQLRVDHFAPNMGEYDAYIFHRIVDPWVVPHIYRLKTMGKTIVWDLDDNLFLVPDWSPAAEMKADGRAETLMMMLDWADIITVTTERFADQLADLGDKIRVLPNLISMSDWDKNEFQDPGDTIRICWAGSMTHQRDLDIAGPSLDRMLDEYPDVKLYFVGQRPTVFNPTPVNNARYRRRVAMLGTAELYYYPDLMEVIRPDIAILPILECDFNNAKSNIKYLEMTLSGAICVGSDVGPYKDTITSGGDGILVKNHGKAWDEGLREAIEMRLHHQGEGVYGKMRGRASDKVRNRYSWDGEQRSVWLDFFRGLAGLSP